MQIEFGELFMQFKLLVTNPIIHFMVGVIIFDILTGLTKAFVCKVANSTKGLTGIIKHTLVILLVIMTYPYMIILNLELYANVVVVFYIVSYSISILENLAYMGVPIPDFLVERLEKVHGRVSKGRFE